ncbi:unnamed protein product, partial [Ceratitis capitata]
LTSIGTLERSDIGFIARLFINVVFSAHTLLLLFWKNVFLGTRNICEPIRTHIATVVLKHCTDTQSNPAAIKQLTTDYPSDATTVRWRDRPLIDTKTRNSNRPRRSDVRVSDLAATHQYMQEKLDAHTLQLQ